MNRAIAKILIVVMMLSIITIPTDVSEAYTGYTKVGKYYYYFNAKGIKQKYSQTINGKPYYFNGAGKGVAKGWITFKDGRKKYSLGNGKLATGYQKVGKYYYYFNAAGIMQKYNQMINGKPYYFNGTGKGVAKGWISFNNGSKKYCLGNGKLATGQLKIGNSNYFFDQNGVLTPKYIVSAVPDKRLTEYEFANKKYKGYCQFARNYKGYNDYLAAHGCGTTTLTSVLCTYIPECRDWTPYETIEIAEKGTVGIAAFNENHSKSHSAQMPITLYGTTKVLNKYGINHNYVSSFNSDDTVKSDIISHLHNGYPVIFIISQKNRETGKKTDKWTGSFHTMLMIGADNKGNVLIINPAGSCRFQLVSLDEMIDYMWSCSKTPNSFYWNTKTRCGGYIKLME